MMHKLTNRDFENLMADCAVCGAVEMYHRSRDNKYLCKKKKNIDAKKYRDNRTGHVRNRTMQDGFFYTGEQKKALSIEQCGKCAICNKELPLEFDHCHETLKGRGLLCHKCNTALGMFNDDLERLESAVRYLQKHIQLTKD